MGNGEQAAVDPAIVIESCHALGFVLAGVAPAEPTRWRQQFLDWLAAGKHGDMGYMAEHVDERLDVRVLLPGAQSVIVVADQYARAGDQDGDCAAAVGQGVVARYARGRDYHAVIRKRVWALVDALRERYPGEAFRPFVDTGPALEREHAVRAGMVAMGSRPDGGFIGKHTLYIHPAVGSFVLLGGVATTMRFRVGGPTIADTDRCGTCTRCIDACPTGAITDYSVDARRCVSYLTLEHRGVIDASLHAGIRDRLLGCDVCQDVCPYNQHQPSHDGVQARVHPAYLDPQGQRSAMDLLEILRARDEAGVRQGLLAGSAGKRASMAMLKRNAIVVAGNQVGKRGAGGAELLREIRRIAGDETESEMVRETAREVMRGIDE